MLRQWKNVVYLFLKEKTKQNKTTNTLRHDPGCVQSMFWQSYWNLTFDTISVKVFVGMVGMKLTSKRVYRLDWSSRSCSPVAINRNVPEEGLMKKNESEPESGKKIDKFHSNFTGNHLWNQEVNYPQFSSVFCENWLHQMINSFRDFSFTKVQQKNQLLGQIFSSCKEEALIWAKQGDPTILYKFSPPYFQESTDSMKVPIGWNYAFMVIAIIKQTSELSIRLYINSTHPYDCYWTSLSL